MKTFFFNVSNKHRKPKNPKISYDFWKESGIFIVYSSCGHEYTNIQRRRINWNIDILGLINKIEEYEKTYSHVGRKHKSRIYIEKYRWNQKLFNWRNKSKWIKE